MATANYMYMYEDLKLSQNSKESRNTSYNRKIMTRISHQSKASCCKSYRLGEKL